MNEQTLFALLRLGLGNSKDIQKENLSDLFLFSERRWQQLKELSSLHGISAIVLDGLQAIMNELGTGCFSRTMPPCKWKTFILQWIGEVQQCYESGNLQQMAVVDNIQKRWSKANISVMLMKGLAIGSYYPEIKHRAPGDIDCYLMSGSESAYKKGNEVARAWADKVDEHWYKHSVISYNGQTIENHQYFVHTREGKNSKKLNQTLCETLKNTHFDTLFGTEVLLPPPMFNALFLTYHGMAHFLEEGLKLKQLLDWAMFLKRDADKVDWDWFYARCAEFHLLHFAEVTTDIAVNNLGVELRNPEIITESPYTAKVIHSTIYDKDYVFSSGQSGWTNRWHIIKNLFKYRWKYNEIYQQSIIKQLYYFAKGFIFKTE